MSPAGAALSFVLICLLIFSSYFALKELDKSKDKNDYEDY